MMFSYENAKLYTDKTKACHDRKIQKRELILGEKVFLFNSQLKFFLGSLNNGGLDHSSCLRYIHLGQ